MTTKVTVTIVLETNLDHEELPSAVTDAFEDSEFFKFKGITSMSAEEA